MDQVYPQIEGQPAPVCEDPYVMRTLEPSASEDELRKERLSFASMGSSAPSSEASAGGAASEHHSEAEPTSSAPASVDGSQGAVSDATETTSITPDASPAPGASRRGSVQLAARRNSLTLERNSKCSTGRRSDTHAHAMAAAARKYEAAEKKKKKKDRSASCVLQ